MVERLPAMQETQVRFLGRVYFICSTDSIILGILIKLFLSSSQGNFNIFSSKIILGYSICCNNVENKTSIQVK